MEDHEHEHDCGHDHSKMVSLPVHVLAALAINKLAETGDYASNDVAVAMDGLTIYVMENTGKPMPEVIIIGLEEGPKGVLLSIGSFMRKPDRSPELDARIAELGDLFLDMPGAEGVLFEIPEDASALTGEDKK